MSETAGGALAVESGIQTLAQGPALGAPADDRPSTSGATTAPPTRPRRRLVGPVLGALVLVGVVAAIGAQSHAGGSSSLPGGTGATSSSQDGGQANVDIARLPRVDDGSNGYWAPDYVILRGVSTAGGGVVLTYDRLQPASASKRGCKLVAYDGGTELASPGRYCLSNNSRKVRTVGVLPTALLHASNTVGPASRAALSRYVDKKTGTPGVSSRVLRLHYDSDNRVDAIYVV